MSDAEPMMTATVDAEPKSTSKKTDAQRAKDRERARRNYAKKKSTRSVRTEVEMTFTIAGTAWSVADEVCGSAFLASVPDLATAIDAWAQTNQQVYEFWSSMTKTSGPLAVAIAAMPVLQTVAAHHVVPAIERRRQRAEHAWEEDDAREITLDPSDPEFADDRAEPDLPPLHGPDFP
jgi:hypothetical protein